MATQPMTDKKGVPRSMRTSLKVISEIWPFIRRRRWILVVGFFFMGISRILGLTVPIATKYLVDDVIVGRRMQLLLPILSFVLAATVIQGLASFGLTRLLTKSSQEMVAELRLKVQKHIGQLPLIFFDENKTGVLISRVMNDVEGVRTLISSGLIDFLGSMITASFALGILVHMNLLMTTVAIAALALCGLMLSKTLKVVRPAYRARPRIQAEITGRLNESLNGIRVVKGYRAEESEARIFAEGMQNQLANVWTTLNASSSLNFSVICLMGTLTTSIMFLGVGQIHKGGMTLGSFMTFSMFLGMLVAPVSQLVGIGPILTEAFAGLERTREILNQEREDDNTERVIQMSPIKGLVAFENVSFAYHQDTEVLHEICFQAPSGSVTALVGPSGAGKSTVIGLIAAFYSASRGQVLVDGIDISRVNLGSYRSQLGVVLQETFLFDGTIRQNVAFARPAASQEEILRVCRLAKVDEFAERFPDAYETMVGERGVRLSGGQRQRISIARAILADPRILILDEATSSLDSESETMIQEGLKHLMEGRTSFVIAHRLSTIREADQILVFDSGRIVERGTHESLYLARGRYFDLYTRQCATETNLFLPTGEEELSKEAGHLERTEFPTDIKPLTHHSYDSRDLSI